MQNQQTIIDNLPNSITYFLCQNIAYLINNNTMAISEIKKILDVKNFYQANMNKTKFAKGDVSFKVVQSGHNKNKVIIIPSKGSMSSLGSDQGRLLYMIK